jgi:hypothetical protein
MRLFLIAGMSLLAAQASAAPAPKQPVEARPTAECKRTTVHHAQRGQPVTPRKLNELPPADLYAAMYRTVNGCEVPLVLTRTPKSR